MPSQGRAPVFLIGLTGGMGSGKSTVADRFREHGITVIDADEVAREVVAPGQDALRELADHFGADIIRADGSLDRGILASRAFRDDRQRAVLDAVTHPRIAARIAERLARLASDPQVPVDALVAVDHPLLIETGQAGRFDAVVVVVAPLEARVERLVRERGHDAADVRRRLAAQTSDDHRRALADHVLVNDGGIDDLRQAVDDLVGRLRAVARVRAGTASRSEDRPAMPVRPPDDVTGAG